VLGPVESWREDIVVRVIAGEKTKEPFDVRGSSRQQFITGENAVMDVAGSRVTAVWKLHEPGKLRMTAVLVRHVEAIVGLKQMNLRIGKKLVSEKKVSTKKQTQRPWAPTHHGTNERPSTIGKHRKKCSPLSM